MGVEVHDYDYIRKHLDEYQFTMSLVKQEVNEMLQEKGINIRNYPPELHKRGLEITFYKKLLDSGEMSMPEKCRRCPFHFVWLNTIGQVCDRCDINTDMYIADLFFSDSSTRPDWCPLGEKK